MRIHVGFHSCRAMLLGIAMLAAASIAVPAGAEPAGQVAALKDGGNVIVGIGLVVGLPGTGDSTVDAALVEGSIVGVLRRAGLDIWWGQIQPGRVAKVMITAELPAHRRDGTPLAVTITAIGDAASLAGGTLLATPLRDEHGIAHAVGQGPIAAGASFAVALDEPAGPGIGMRSGRLAQSAVLDAGRFRQVAVD